MTSLTIRIGEQLLNEWDFIEVWGSCVYAMWVLINEVSTHVFACKKRIVT